MTPPHDLDDIQDVVWYVKYFWHMITGGSVAVGAFVLFIFREALKQMVIDKVVARFKKSEKQIEKDAKKEIQDARVTDSRNAPSTTDAKPAKPIDGLGKK